MKKYKIGDLCKKIYSGGTPSTNNPAYWNGNLPWLSSSETGKGFIFSTSFRITELAAKESASSLVYKGTPIIATAGEGKTRGQVSFLQIDAYINQSLIAFVADEKKIIPLYLYYNLKNSYKRLRSISDITGVRGSLSGELLNQFELYIHDLPEQRIISEFLFTIDKIIINNERQIKLLENIIKDTYDYWFIQFDFPNEDGKPYKSSGGKMVWNAKLRKDIPVGWSQGNLYEIADFINGLACQNYRPVSNETCYNVIKIKEINSGITTETEKCSTKIDEKYIIRDGDLLFSWSASLIVKYWYGGIGALNQHIFKVQPKNELLSEYCYQAISNYILTFKRIANSRKTTMGHITSDHLRQSLIIIPDNNILKQFNIYTTSIRERVKLCHQEINKFKELKTFILPLLMNGQVSFKNI